MQRIERAIEDAVRLGQSKDGQPGLPTVLVIGAEELRALIVPADAPASPRIGDEVLAGGPASAAVREVTLLDSEIRRIVADEEPVTLLDIRSAGEWYYIINNGLNEAVTLALVGNNTAEPAGALDLNWSVEVAANSRRLLYPTNPWSGFQGWTATTEVAPTSGRLLITGFTQSLPW